MQLARSNTYEMILIDAYAYPDDGHLRYCAACKRLACTFACACLLFRTSSMTSLMLLINAKNRKCESSATTEELLMNNVGHSIDALLPILYSCTLHETFDEEMCCGTWQVNTRLSSFQHRHACMHGYLLSLFLCTSRYVLAIALLSNLGN